jgi:hypothetical protein
MGPMGFYQNKIVLVKTIMIEALNLCFGQNKKVLTKTKKFWEKPFPKISRATAGRPAVMYRNVSIRIPSRPQIAVSEFI